jgi:hypothetical protein
MDVFGYLQSFHESGELDFLEAACGNATSNLRCPSKLVASNFFGTS